MKFLLAIKKYFLATAAWLDANATIAKTWLADHEKILIPIYIVAIYLWRAYPEYVENAGIAFLLYKIFDIGTDKSSNSMLKDMKGKIDDIHNNISGKQ